ncbi:MAG: glycosyltransferase [Conexibacter sp.]
MTRIAAALALGDGADREIAVVGADGWEGRSARVVVAWDDASDDPLEGLRAIEATATRGGWRIAHAGLVQRGTTPPRHCPLVVGCRPDDEEVAQLLDNGPLSLALDPIARTAGPGRPARVLIASYEISGPTGNGGIGTAYHSLAHVLAAAGHDVTLLFTGWLDPERAAEEASWRAAFAEAGIAFALLGTPWDVPVRSPHHQVRRAYELHRWLMEAHTARPFDIVHVPECQGHGAFALTAKALGLAYRDVDFVVGTHSSTRWVGEANRDGLEDLDQLVTEHLERLSVERADVVMSPTAYLVDYTRERGWSLPERTFVQPLARPRSVRALGREQIADKAGPRSELVFFGRLETRKGVEAFCDAVDLLTADDDCPFERVTLLGRPEHVTGEPAEAYVARRAERWGLAWRILPDLGHDEAIDYLRRAPCVVAIPSLVDNSPNTVIEAVALGVPFVASRSGGTAELIAPDDLARCTFDGWRDAEALEPPAFGDAQDAFDVRALAAALRAKALDPGAPAAPAVDDAACDRVYDAWHRAIAGRPRTARPTQAGAQPTATVLLTGGDGGDIHRIAAALATGTRPPAAVVAICDDAIPNPPNGVEVVVAPGRAAAAARRRIAATLDSDLLIVLRGDEQPDPLLVACVVGAMRDGDADVLSLVCRDPSTERPTGTPQELRRMQPPRDLCAFVPVGGPPLASAAYPALSVGPYAIRREALAAIDGWAPDLWGEALDHELLSRAALAGMRIDVLPDPLATSVRDDRWADVRARYWGWGPVPAAYGEQQIRLLRPFRRRLDGPLGDLPALLVGALRASGEVHTRIERERELVETYERRIEEHRDLIALYEEQKEEMRAALAQRPVAHAPRTSRRIAARARRALRPPLSDLPRRAVRFARWRAELVRRRVR